MFVEFYDKKEQTNLCKVLFICGGGAPTTSGQCFDVVYINKFHQVVFQRGKYVLMVLHSAHFLIKKVTLSISTLYSSQVYLIDLMSKKEFLELLCKFLHGKMK